MATKYKIVATGQLDRYEVRSYVDAKFFNSDIVCENFVCRGTYKYCKQIIEQLEERN